MNNDFFFFIEYIFSPTLSQRSKEYEEDKLIYKSEMIFYIWR